MSAVHEIEIAKKWTCDRCRMSVSNMNGERTALPGTWTRTDEGQFCLMCRRELAGVEALESAPVDSSHEDRATIRRDALLEFEVSRAPENSDREIAKACRSTVPAVVKARDRLQLPRPAVPA
jgi:hypothetical protein